MGLPDNVAERRKDATIRAVVSRAAMEKVRAPAPSPARCIIIVAATENSIVRVVDAEVQHGHEACLSVSR